MVGKGLAVLKFHAPVVAKSGFRSRFAGVALAFAMLAAGWGGTASAEPSQDLLTKLNELNKKVEQLTQTINAAQADFDNKMRVLAEADAKQVEDLAALETAKVRLADYQRGVDRIAAAVYMGGRADAPTAILTSSSPTRLIDKLSVQRVMAVQASGQMRDFRQAIADIQVVEAASAKSAAEARIAADSAATVRADLQKQQSELKAQLAAVADEAALTAQPSAVLAAMGIVAPMPTVGVNGLVPNARRLLQYIMTTYPGVRSIGGVRADPLPDHPSGHALDVMIGSDMGLGDAINADIQSQAARFGVSYTMWRVAAHFDHVHITVN